MPSGAGQATPITRGTSTSCCASTSTCRPRPGGPSCASRPTRCTRCSSTGTRVHHGPARCYPDRQSFDTLDLTPLLQPGPNVIGVIAYQFGAETVPAHLPWRERVPARRRRGAGGRGDRSAPAHADRVDVPSCQGVAAADGTPVDAARLPGALRRRPPTPPIGCHRSSRRPRRTAGSRRAPWGRSARILGC